jgi:hypothetical protein
MLEVKRDDKHGAGIRLLLRGKVQGLRFTIGFFPGALCIGNSA